MSGKLIVGRINLDSDGQRVIEPLHRLEVQTHQQKVAGLIAAAYLFRDDPTPKHRRDLLEAAKAL